MAIASLHEAILSSIVRRNQLTQEIAEFQSQKMLLAYSQGDIQGLMLSEETEIRNEYKELFDCNPDEYENYTDYTEIPDFEEAIERITAKYNSQLEDLSVWETMIDNQITTCSAEQKELEAYTDSYKKMLSDGISNDFNYAGGGGKKSV